MIAGLLGTACSDGPTAGTDVGNGRSAIQVDARGYGLPVASGESMVLESGERIDRLFVAVEGIRLEPGTSCESGGGGEIDVEGPLVADLLAQGFTGGPVRFDADSGMFCELRFTFHALSDPGPSGLPPELAGLSIVVEGERADGSVFRIASDRGDELRLEAKDEAFTLADPEEPLFLAFDLSSWIAAVDLSSLGPGPVEVSDDVNQDRLASFEEAVEISVRLFEDIDKDGVLSSGEASDGASLVD